MVNPEPSLPAPRFDPETANAITHGLGFLLSLAGLYFLAEWAAPFGDMKRLIGCLVFGTTLVLLYAASTLLHSCKIAAWQRRYTVADHCAIYLLIAGTYTPIFLTPMQGPVGTTYVVMIWLIAAGGIVFKIVCGTDRHVGWSIASYLVAGWLPVLVIGEMIERIAPEGLFWLVLGGVFYTVGVPFYLSRRFVYSHAIWHLFVLAASACHFRAVVCAVLRNQ